jgi:hypoxanthine-DNA glycosylase
MVNLDREHGRPAGHPLRCFVVCLKDSGATRRGRGGPEVGRAWVGSFAPVARRDAEVLILGSMPGVASLAAGQYYAHPRNAFWPIVGAVVGFAADAPYPARLKALKEARIALWDVLHTCRREGSLDSSIEEDGLVANDFAAFLARHRGIGRVVLNGGKAAECWQRHVVRAGVAAGLECVRLPSTSPANASWSRERKLAAWREALAARR